MKRTLPLIPLLMAIVTLLISCSASNQLSNDPLVPALNEKPTLTNCFIHKTDGTVVNYQSLRLVNTVFRQAYLLADGKTRIYPAELLAYQTPEYYAVSQKQFANGHKSFVSMDCLPGFGIRVTTGKINVYTKKFYNGSIAADEYYLQKGTNGPIRAYSKKMMKEVLQDDEQAQAYFFGKGKTVPLGEKILVTASILNRDPSLSKN
ncbi:MAG: hypothetical protein IPP31_12045 [Chitinophagaceae bacterium]|nr:hypothetical protein [Chitinophagaceae bacterium]